MLCPETGRDAGLAAGGAQDRCLRETLQGLRDREVRQAKGRSEGKAEGLAEGKVLIAKAMVAKGMDRNTISEITGLSDEELESL